MQPVARRIAKRRRETGRWDLIGDVKKHRQALDDEVAVAGDQRRNGAAWIDCEIVRLTVLVALDDDHAEPGSRSSLIVSLGICSHFKRNVACQRASAWQDVKFHETPGQVTGAAVSRATRSAANSGNAVMPFSVLRCLPPRITRSGAPRRSAISRLNRKGT